ncbi:MAG: peptidylprolyl isomerase [Calothrix sp. MO_167.B42]|nr:peptidylprolyl isomerase [Calothrix sp. MO_167.B42]
MLHLSYLMFKLLKSCLHNSVISLLLVILFLATGTLGWTLPSYAGLPAGNAITDGKALLRYALPIDNKPVRDLQGDLEDISNQMRANRRWSAVSKDVSKALRVLDKPAKILESVPEPRQAQAETLIAKLKEGVSGLQDTVSTRDKVKISQERSQLLDIVGELEGLMVDKFPFEIPEEYSNLAQLKGRATIELETNKGNMTMIVDGYSAPITAGNFVDLVGRGFYDGLEFTRAEESYVVQTGDPPGKEFGFIDPQTGEYRSIPLEILVEGEEEPLYGFTFEELGLYTEQPRLPFSAYGAVGMARSEADINNASSQFFFLLFDSELTPAGRNILDGRYSVFGYVVEGKDVLGKIKAGDKIVSAKVVQGIENFVPPKTA